MSPALMPTAPVRLSRQALSQLFELQPDTVVDVKLESDTDAAPPGMFHLGSSGILMDEATGLQEVVDATTPTAADLRRDLLTDLSNAEGDGHVAWAAAVRRASWAEQRLTHLLQLIAQIDPEVVADAREAIL